MTPTTPLPLPLRRRLWPKTLGGKLVVILAFAILLVAGLWFAALVATERRLAAVVERCRELGLNVQRSPSRPYVAEELNAAVPLHEACESAYRTITQITARSAKLNVEDLEEVYSAAAKQLTRDPNYERLLKEADERADFWYRTDSENSSSLWPPVKDHLTDVVQIETKRAHDEAAAERPNEAMERMLRLLRLYRKRMGNDPSLGFAPRFFAQRIVFEEMNRELRERLIAKEVHDQIEAELSNDDDFVGSLTPQLSQRQFNDLLELKRAQSPLYRHFIFRPLANIDQAFAYERFEISLRGRTKSYVESAKQVYLVHPLAGVPYLDQQWHTSNGPLQVATFARMNGDIYRARIRCLRILNATSRKKDFRSKLDSLGLPAECLVDPFDGRMLRVVNGERGLTIYSIGPNCQDDHGLVDTPNQIFDVGFGPPGPTTETTK